MPRPRLTKDMTTTNVARQLGMTAGQVIRWVENGVLPVPTSIDNNGVRYFDEDWLKKARDIVTRKKSDTN